jgi:hypothetical protein
MLDTPALTRTADGDLYVWQSSNEPAVEQEPAMPTPGLIGKVLMISTVPSWETVVDWYADLAASRTKATFEIKEQVARLFEGKTTWTTDEKIKKIYDFVTSEIRYSSVPFRQSGIIPQKARDVLVNRIGDCKDVATLGIAMLREVGVPANYVLVRTRSLGSDDGELPSINFNHCIVAIQTEHGLRYADFTAHYHPLEALPGEDCSAWCLLIKKGTIQAQKYQPPVNAPSTVARTIEGTWDADNTLSVHQVSTYSGDAAAETRDLYVQKGQEDRKKQLASFLTADFPDVKLLTSDFTNLNNHAVDMSLDYTFRIQQYGISAGRFTAWKLPWLESFKESGLFSAEKRTYPMLLYSDMDTVSERLHITLPANSKPVDAGRKVHYSCSVADYTLDIAYANHTLTGVRRLVFKKQVVAPEEYDAFKKFASNIMKEENKQLLFGNK